jgi:hypothetical protein
METIQLLQPKSELRPKKVSITFWTVPKDMSDAVQSKVAELTVYDGIIGKMNLFLSLYPVNQEIKKYGFIFRKNNLQQILAIQNAYQVHPL